MNLPPPVDKLRQLQGELALVQRAAQAERERIAALADLWGHKSFAHHLRTHKPCADCRGIGYDASGQVCACQFADEG